MAIMRNVVYGRLVFGGIDPTTGRFKPDTIDRIQREDLEFAPVGGTTQANIGGVLSKINNEKIAIRKQRFKNQDYFMAHDMGGDLQLYRFVTQTPHIGNNNLVWLLVAQENPNAQNTIRIMDALKKWMES